MRITFKKRSLHPDWFKLGVICRLEHFDRASPSYQRKLMAMGLLPGSVLTIIGLSPLAVTCQVACRTDVWSLRTRELMMCALEPIDMGA